MVDRIRTISIPPVGLEGLLGLTVQARGIVLFAQGSGSGRGRFSPRNNFVAQALREAGLATLLFDLLTDDEARDRRNVFDIALLARRLLMAANWARDDAETTNLPVGYFGASTGAAAALVAAAANKGSVTAIVSRGGRPDLAGPALRLVKAPTLLIVGGEDAAVLALNRAAFAELCCEKELVVVPGATHLFEEPGTLEAVVEHARGWFLGHFGEVGE
jgi:putative phosphoribosyl transferase